MLRRTWNRWKAIAQVIGDFQARIILTLFYFVLITPGALIVRAVSDPLRLNRPRSGSLWTAHPSEPQRLDDARRQY